MSTGQRQLIYAFVGFPLNLNCHLSRVAVVPLKGNAGALWSDAYSACLRTFKKCEKICGVLFKLFNESLFCPMNGQVKWQTLSRVSALEQEQRLKRRKSHAKQQYRLQIQR